MPPPFLEYQNKEKESTFNLRRISFGARTYNASIGRFDGVDALAHNSISSSPFSYVYNNPLLFVDPDGNEGDYYDNGGEYLGNDGINDDKVYVVEDGGVKSTRTENGVTTNTILNSKRHDLGVSHTTFLAFAAVIHAESSGNLNESMAIGNVTMNFLSSGGSSQLKTLADVSLFDNTFAQGATQSNYTEFMELTPSERNSKFALRAAINAVGYNSGLSGTIDYSNGANSWDGIDLIASGNKNNHRNYTWSSDSKDLLKQYKKANNGGVNVEGFTYKDSGYQISATSIIGKTLYTSLKGGRGERKQNASKFK